MWSISSRLLRYMIGGQLLVILLMVTAAGIALSLAAQDYFKSRLEHDRDLLLNEMLWPQPGSADIPGLEHHHLPPIFTRPYSGHYFQISGDQVAILSDSLQQQRLQLPDDHQLSVNVPYWSWQPLADSQYLYVLTQTIVHDGWRLQLQVAEDFHPIIRVFLRAFWSLAGLFSLLMIGFFLLQRRLLSNTLAPFTSIGAQLKKLTRQEIDELPLPPVQELAPLVTEINRMGERMRERLQRARLASGNLSHSLKTPLAILANRLTDMQDQCHGDELAEARQQVQRMTQQIDNEMKRARIAGVMSRAPRVDINGLFEQLQATLKKLYPACSVNLQLQPGQSYPGDREDMFELFGNLLDNACKWAHSTVDVDISVSADHRFIARIRDDGPGIEQQQIERLLGPGERLDESVAGYGLGLAIVTDIVAQYQGTMTLRNRADQAEQHGLEVEVSLPL